MQMALQEATDALVYCDSDVVFVQPVERLWAHLRRLTPRQAIAVAPTSGHPLGGSASNEYMIRRTGGDGGDDVSLYQINSGVSQSRFRAPTRLVSRDTLRTDPRKGFR